MGATTHRTGSPWLWPPAANCTASSNGLAPAGPLLRAALTRPARTAKGKGHRSSGGQEAAERTQDSALPATQTQRLITGVSWMLEQVHMCAWEGSEHRLARVDLPLGVSLQAAIHTSVPCAQAWTSAREPCLAFTTGPQAASYATMPSITLWKPMWEATCPP